MRPELGALPCSIELSSSQSGIWQPSDLSTGSQRLEGPNAAGPVSGWSRRRQAGGRPARLQSHLNHRSDIHVQVLRLHPVAHQGASGAQTARKRTTVSGMRRWSSRARCVPETHRHPVDFMVVTLHSRHSLLGMACRRPEFFSRSYPSPRHSFMLEQ